MRLTEAEKRRIRTLAVSQGLTLGQAAVEAFEAWAAQLASRALPADPARSTPASAALEKPGRPDRTATPRRDHRRAEGKPPAAPGGGPVPNLGALAGDWPARAMQLDWSKCSAAECVQTKTGNVWVASGTLVPLVHIFEAVAGDNPLPEIAEVYDLTLQQLIAILQFAAESAARGASKD